MIIQQYSQKNLSFRDKILSLDFTLIILVLILGIISFFAMYSTEQGKFGYYTQSHIYRFCVFFLFFIFLSFFQISTWYRFSYIFYILVLMLLFAVDFFGITASGSKRWINLFFINLQPSELMKIGLILFLAKYYHRTSIENVNKIKYLFTPIFVLIFPVLLVVLQPDLGTAILIASGGVVVAWLAGVRAKFFGYATLIFISLLPIAISFLKPYQKARILTFLNPEKDPLGAGYQIIQSKIAIGSGGLFGKGFLNGSQSYLDYLPEKHTDFIFTLFSEEFGFLGSGGILGKGYLMGSQSYLDYLPEKHTDFIFTLFSEEFGFVGSICLLVIYILIIYRIIKIGNNSKNNFARVYCFGFATAFFIYVTVNMMMVLGLLPIVGAPLPIMSYGGSSMLSIMIGLGLVMSCNIYKGEQIK